jgi:hypothetical protein
VRGASVAACGLALAALLCAPTASLADAFYKWVDKDGKTQYGDHPPKNFSGEVTRVEIDAPATPSPVPVPRPAADGAKKAPTPPDVAEKRRELRAKLAADLARARAKLDLARAHLTDDAAPQDDERQIVQQRVEKGMPMPGSGAMHGSAPRSNCSVITGTDGKSTLVCPTMIPNEAYRERQQKLEEAVRQAEEELAAAEQAYRRGVD